MKRRRFLAISAAFLGAPAAWAETTTWRAPALGGEVRVDLRGPKALSAEVAARIGAVAAEVEAAASLFRPDSALARLNAAGGLDPAPRALVEMLAAADLAHRATEGVFDPTVQPLWRALAEGRDPTAARAALGWSRVVLGAAPRLGAGQALTLNGLAQGYAADRAREVLAEAGYGQALIDMGEFAALGGPFALGMSDPGIGMFGDRRIEGGALAVSSPGAMRIGSGFHILGPRGEPARWSTVAVEAQRATIADAASTAFCLMEPEAIDAARARLPGVGRVTLVDFAGDMRSL